MKTVASILLFCVLSFAAAAKNDNTNLASLQKQVASLETGVSAAEAIRAVKRLQYAYGHYAEFGLWQDLADLFAQNGVGHYPSGSLDREGIRKLFLDVVGKGKIGLDDGQLYPHIMLQPVVTVEEDGRKVRGRWRVLAMLGSYGGDAIWAGGVYENEYILEKGVWKINDLRYYSKYTGRYEQDGWTVDRGEAPLPPEPARAGTPIPPRPDAVPATKERLTLKDLSHQLSDIRRRAQILSDEAEVENLQHVYGYYVDRKMWDDVADLFAEDGTMEIGLQGVYVGKARIRRALDRFGPRDLREGELNDRLQIQTVVHVAPDGRTAKARCVELAMSGINGVGARWEEGVFENEFVKNNGVWQIRSLQFYPRLLTDYDKGWAKDAQPPPGPDKNFPPDRLPMQLYKTFPGFFVPPFHFTNPVSGLAVRYPKGTNHAFRLERYMPTRSNEPDARTGAELSKRIADAERLLRIAIARDAAENLASAYGYYLDEAMWDETADLFAREGRRRFSSISDEVGRETIRQSFKRRYPGKKSTDYFTAHQLVQPVIHVEGDGLSAKMRVRLFQLAGASGGSGLWLAGIYECRTGLEDGVWKFTSMSLDYTWTADYKSGWARVSEKNKGIVDTPFPRIVDLPFHYVNPVSGRKPPVLLPLK